MKTKPKLGHLVDNKSDLRSQFLSLFSDHLKCNPKSNVFDWLKPKLESKVSEHVLGSLKTKNFGLPKWVLKMSSFVFRLRLPKKSGFGNNFRCSEIISEIYNFGPTDTGRTLSLRLKFLVREYKIKWIWYGFNLNNEVRCIVWMCGWKYSIMAKKLIATDFSRVLCLLPCSAPLPSFSLLNSFYSWTRYSWVEWLRCCWVATHSRSCQEQEIPKSSVTSEDKIDVKKMAFTFVLTFSTSLWSCLEKHRQGSKCSYMSAWAWCWLNSSQRAFVNNKMLTLTAR